MSTSTMRSGAAVKSIRNMVVAAVITATPVWAQQNDGLEEVLVTAQRREQKLQDVPIAITAISGAQIENRGITNVQALEAFTPNLQISPTPGNSTAAQIAIRGSTTNNPALTLEPAVGIYVDGVYIGKTQGSIFDLVEIDRIEVLRGPQGTLWGRNTLAGAFNVVTRKPSGEFKATAALTAGNFGALGARASIDFPSAGTVRANLAVRTLKRDGWISNGVGNFPTPPGRNVSTSELNDVDSKSARFALDADLSDSFDLAYRFDYSKADQAASHSQLYRSLLPFLAPYVSRAREERATVDGPAFERSTVQGHSLTASWRVNERNTLKSITSLRKLKWDDSLDLDGSPLNIAHTQRLSDYDSQSQELQWLGNYDRVNLVAGLYYFKDDGFTNNPQAFFVEFGPAVGVNFKSQYGFDTKAIAAFGQADFKVSDTVTLTAGLRYTDEDKTISRCAGLVGIFDYVPCNTTAKTSFSKTTPLAIVAWQPRDWVNLYVKYAEGFKSGGFNGEAGDPANAIPVNIAQATTPYRAEVLESKEIGAKLTFAEGRGNLNLALFDNDSNDMQLSIFEAMGAANSSLKNAGRANVSGFEIEGSWHATENFTLNLAYGHMSGDFDEFIDGGVNAAKNRVLTHLPENTWSASIDAGLGSLLGGKVGLLLDANFVDDYFLYSFPITNLGAADPSSQNSALAGDTRVPSHTLVNARLAISDVALGNAQFEAAVWSRNLLDEKYIQNMIDFGPGFGSLTQVYWGLPRTYGVDLTLRW